MTLRVAVEVENKKSTFSFGLIVYAPVETESEKVVEITSASGY
jgi:hypothetical protein